MVKLVAFFKRKPGSSVESFQSHWGTRHAELVARLPGLRRYVQNRTLPSGYRSREPVFDGVAEAWFDDTDAMRALVGTAEWEAVRADEPGFLDRAGMGSLITHEVVIVDGPAPENAAKLIAFLKRRPDLDVAAFQKHWRELHGPIAARIPGNRRYVQCHVHRGIYEAGREPAFDGVPMSWFDDLDAMRRSGDSPEYAATRADEANFLVGEPLPFVIATEHEIPL